MDETTTQNTNQEQFPDNSKLSIPYTYKPINRECIRRNIFPVSVKKVPSFTDWYNSYSSHLFNLYNIFSGMITEHFDIKINWVNNRKFINFCKVIYHCSSKHISKYL